MTTGLRKVCFVEISEDSSSLNNPPAQNFQTVQGERGPEKRDWGREERGGAMPNRLGFVIKLGGQWQCERYEPRCGRQARAGLLYCARQGDVGKLRISISLSLSLTLSHSLSPPLSFPR